MKTCLTILSLFVLSFATVGVKGQEIGVYNEEGKKIYKLKPGRNLDFRIDYKTIYPDQQGKFVEARMFSRIDSISGNTLFLDESIVVTGYTSGESVVLEEAYEFTDFKVELGDIKGLNFTPMAASIGNSLFAVGIATILASPLLGLTPDGFSTSRFGTVAGIGAAVAATGAVFKFGFRQKPVKIKDFEGPDYFKKYQKGSLSQLE